MHEICHLMSKLPVRGKLSWRYRKNSADKILQSRFLKWVLFLILHEDQHLNVCFILMKRNNVQSPQLAALFFRNKILWVDTCNSLAITVTSETNSSSKWQSKPEAGLSSFKRFLHILTQLFNVKHASVSITAVQIEADLFLGRTEALLCTS